MIQQSQKFNANYAAKIVNINEFRAHSNPEVNKLKVARVDGFDIVVGLDTEPGLYIYFPVGCAIDSEFLKLNNLFRDSNKNANPEVKPGFFEDNGRVKAIMLRGEKSQGFIIPVSSLNGYISDAVLDIQTKDIGVDFDMVNDKRICRKFIVQQTQKAPGTGTRQGKKAKKEKAIHLVEDQFRFHVDTILLRKMPNVIKPDSLISVTSKWHGTSGISANLLQEIPIEEGTLKKLWRKIQRKPEPFKEEYRDVCSSRTVIKDPYNNPGVGGGYYGVDIWNIAHEVLKPHLTKGLTLYYEIVGFLPTGGYIQKGYDYGFEPPKEGETFTYGKHFGIRIYRITYTNVSGYVFELSARQVQLWCERNNLLPVIQLYYGYAKDLYPTLNVENHWNENFIEALANDKRFYMELDSPDCNNKVPHEGIVIRNETLNIDVYKLKCFRFLKKEDESMDKGEVDIETEN